MVASVTWSAAKTLLWSLLFAILSLNNGFKEFTSSPVRRCILLVAATAKAATATKTSYFMLKWSIYGNCARAQRIHQIQKTADTDTPSGYGLYHFIW